MPSKSELIIVTKEPFPDGMAATNRIISYAKEIAKIKNTTVLISKPTEKKNKVKNTSIKGEINYLKFEYTAKTTVWPKEKSKIKKFNLILKSFFNLIIRIYQLKPKVIILYTPDYYLRSLIFILKKFMNFKLFIEETEYPKIFNRSKRKLSIKRYLKHYKKCDGMLVMTNELKAYYSNLKTKRIFILPMTVDIDRFETNNDNITIENYFVYVGGSGGFKRDGVKNIIEGFNSFFKDNPQYKLYIVGPLDKSNPLQIEIEKYLHEENILEQVIFKGAVSSSEIPNYLNRATGIVMTPQENFISGGFPTKLGEFLASGRPVIVTDVGEISRYLSKRNSFLIKPGNNILIAKAMKGIISDVNKANEIGKIGKETAIKFFTIHSYKEDLINFLFQD